MSQVSLLRPLAETYARGGRVTSVAVVGNAPLAPDPERAAAIDACDLVVRVNGFVADQPGEAPKYGRRTDVVFLHRWVHPTPDVFDDYRQRLYLLLEPELLYWSTIPVPSSWPVDLGQVHLSNAEVMAPLSAALGLTRSAFPRWASSGTAAVWWARRTFPESAVRVAGMSLLSDSRQAEFVHASGGAVEVAPMHDLAAEARLLTAWARRGIITAEGVQAVAPPSTVSTVPVTRPAPSLMR